MIAGLSENKLPDVLISLLTLSVVSLPEFVTGLFLVNIVALRWGRSALAESLGWWFPASSAVPATASFGEMLPALWLPAFAATLVMLAYISRLTRAGVIEELKRDYVRTAALKGIAWRTVVWRHVLRNALLPTSNCHRHQHQLAGQRHGGDRVCLRLSWAGQLAHRRD